MSCKILCCADCCSRRRSLDVPTFLKIPDGSHDTSHTFMATVLPCPTPPKPVSTISRVQSVDAVVQARGWTSRRSSHSAERLLDLLHRACRPPTSKPTTPGDTQCIRRVSSQPEMSRREATGMATGKTVRATMSSFIDTHSSVDAHEEVELSKTMDTMELQTIAKAERVGNQTLTKQDGMTVRIRTTPSRSLANGYVHVGMRRESSSLTLTATPAVSMAARKLRQARLALAEILPPPRIATVLCAAQDLSSRARRLRQARKQGAAMGVAMTTAPGPGRVHFSDAWSRRSHHESWSPTDQGRQAVVQRPRKSRECGERLRSWSLERSMMLQGKPVMVLARALAMVPDDAADDDDNVQRVLAMAKQLQERGWVRPPRTDPFSHRPSPLRLLASSASTV